MSVPDTACYAQQHDVPGCYTKTRAAQILGLSRQTVIRMVQSGELGVIRVRNVERVPISELERILTPTTRTPKRPAAPTPPH